MNSLRLYMHTSAFVQCHFAPSLVFILFCSCKFSPVVQQFQVLSATIFGLCVVRYLKNYCH